MKFLVTVEKVNGNTTESVVPYGGPAYTVENIVNMIGENFDKWGWVSLDLDDGGMEVIYERGVASYSVVPVSE